MATGFLPGLDLIPPSLLGTPGTRIVFNQAAAPTGWVQDVSTAMSDCSMRVLNTAGGGAGGTTGWSAWNFGGTFSLNTFTLSVAQLPAHNHVDVGHAHGLNDPTHSHGTTTGAQFLMTSGAPNTVATGSGGPAAVAASLIANGTGISIALAAANIANTGSGGGIQPSYTTPQVKYTDCIIGVKS